VIWHIWHTQGSGKSLAYGLLCRADCGPFKHGESDRWSSSPTAMTWTTRFSGTSGMCRDLVWQTPQQAESHEDLRRVLNRPSGRATDHPEFSLAKGESDYPVLIDRRNVVVIADEAHRNQYGLKARVEKGPARFPTALLNTCATLSPMRLSSALRERRLRKRT